MSVLSIDFETRSTIDLPAVGVYGYALSDTTDILCAAYAFGDTEPDIWRMGEPCPEAIVDHVKSGGIVRAYNANFERIMWKGVAARRYGWPMPKLEQFQCTMVRALAMALPGKLELAAPALGLDLEKDMKGARLMMQMCKPRTTAPLTWWEDEERLQRLYEYCKQDVRVEIALEKRLVELSEREHRVYYLDQKINDRGVRVDAALCVQAERIVDQSYKMLDSEIFSVTDGKVNSCAAVQQIVNYLKNRGIDTNSVNKESITDLLGRDDIPDDCRRVLEIRQEAAKASVAKIHSMLTRMNGDQRMRGNLQFNGAATGRWAARGTQLQNLPRPKEKDIEGALKVLRYGDAKRVDMLFGPPLSVVSDCIRSMVLADPDKDLIASDFSNIEGRVNAWMAGQEDKVRLFANGEPIYEIMASKIFGKPVETIGKDDFERHVGKAAELGCGYGMGAKKFRETCRKAGIVITQEESEKIVKAWRAANDRIVDFWNGAEQAAVRAIQNPGKTFSYGYLSYRVNGSFLWCKLPSGRLLCYPYPQLVEREAPWSKSARLEWANGITLQYLPELKPLKPSFTEDDFKARYDEIMKWYLCSLEDVQISACPEKEMKVAIVHKGIDTYTRKWGETTTYGGKLVENAVQATARDIMAEAMLRLEEKGYPVVLTVHDEVVSEVSKSHGQNVWHEKRKTFYDPEFDRIMSEVPYWAAGCPIEASGWRGDRYRK